MSIAGVAMAYPLARSFHDLTPGQQVFLQAAEYKRRQPQ